MGADQEKSKPYRGLTRMNADQKIAGIARIANPHDMPSRIPSASLGEPQW
jgi:hypothetical protein